MRTILHIAVLCSACVQKVVRGQVEAVERALETELACADVLMLVAAVRRSVSGLTAELMKEHIRHHVVDLAREPDANCTGWPRVRTQTGD